ncbi:hypothetical protein Pmar_PMAR020036 [Perkinsus marinus ATCC 50983]|uniref:Uncharacterized protein n=1 Tax=Perkinsus marinus (strain ATCC 50983 / TXsc) TaxID=423536 RepID=C5L0J4_PERM5|nr:hypothetical protein Pmar_PMAR020036 [Perkinsus marinus ATCC 50983]EER09742.1 hypothetical protein Pmar_PMAR020036 [Perkinsus marinus ATCC 50983]|eukprot:XP_002777947.1 hypothetical protein Pmar_PMAR020036 [Perkinsus marinus ATCC 50983]
MAERDAQLADEFLRQLDAKASSTVFDSPHRCSRTVDRKRNHARKRSSTTRPSSLQSLTLEVETIDEKISEARKMGLLSDPNVGKATAAGPPDVLVNLTRDRSLTTPNSANYLMTPPSLMDSPTPVLLHAKVIRFLWAWIPLGSYRLTYYPAGKFLPSSQLTPVRFSPLWGQQNDGTGGAASEGIMEQFYWPAGSQKATRRLASTG